jgi:hypothetical protein
MNSTIAISPSNDHRLAALFYDKVLPVMPHNQNIPEEIRYRGLDDTIAQHCTGTWLQFLADKAIQKKIKPNGFIDFQGPLELKRDNSSSNLFARHLNSILSSKNILSVPLYLSDDSYNCVLTCGDINILEIVIKNIPNIDFKDLSWVHIKEVRQDPDFKVKAMKFRTFLYENYAGKDKSYISDSIQLKIHNFEKTCKQNGLKVRFSIYKLLLNSKCEWAKAALTAMLLMKGLSLEPAISLISTGLLAIGNILINFSEMKMNVSENENNEIALLMDIKRVVPNKDNCQ